MNFEDWKKERDQAESTARLVGCIAIVLASVAAVVIALSVFLPLFWRVP